MRLHKLYMLTRDRCRLARDYCRTICDWFRYQLPFVRRSTYMFLAEAAALYHDELRAEKNTRVLAGMALSKAQSEFKRQHAADVELVEELNFKNTIAQTRITDLVDKCDTLRRLYHDERTECARLKKLLEECHRLSAPTNLRSDLEVIKELLT